MKKKYQAPEIKVVNVRTHLLNTGSPITVTNLQSGQDVGLKLGSVGSSYSPRSREFDWDDEEE